MKRPTFESLKIPLAYAAAGLLSFFFFIFATLPYDALKGRLITEAENEGYALRIGSIGPGFFGVTARNVQISKTTTDDPQKPSEPLKVASLTLRPSLFPMGASISADVFGGSIRATVGGLSDQSVLVKLSDINFAKGGFKAFTGIDMEGTANGQLSLDIPATAPNVTGKGKSPNLAEANGVLNLNFVKANIRGGTVTVPYYGQMTPINLPRLNLGNVEATVKFDKGLGKIEKCAAHDGDLDFQASGTIKLGRQVEYSEANLALKLKGSPELMRNGFIGLGLSALPRNPSSPGFRAARVTGFLTNPNFQPGA